MSVTIVDNLERSPINFPDRSIHGSLLSHNLDNKNQTSSVLFSPTKAVIINLINGILGSGILAVPYVFQESGIILGTSLIIFFAVVCAYTLELLMKCATIAKTKNYEDLCENCFGLYGYWIVSISFVLLEIGSMISDSIIMVDSLLSTVTIFSNQFKTYHFEFRALFLTIIYIIMLPLCLFRDISSLKMASLVAVTVNLIIVSCIVYKFVYFNIASETYHNIDTTFANYSVDNILFELKDLKTIPNSLGIVAYTSMVHDSFLLICKTLNNIYTSQEKWNYIIWFVIGFNLFIQFVAGIAGYLTFGNETKDNVLLNYNNHDGIIIFAKLIKFVTEVAGIPYAVFIARHIFFSIYVKFIRSRKQTEFVQDTSKVGVVSEPEKPENMYQNTSLRVHLVYTLPMWFCSLVMVIFTDNLGLVMSITGSLASLTLTFTLPTACYIKLTHGTNFITTSSLVKASCVCVIGIVLTVFCPAWTLWQHFQ